MDFKNKKIIFLRKETTEMISVETALKKYFNVIIYKSEEEFNNNINTAPDMFIFDFAINEPLISYFITDEIRKNAFFKNIPIMLLTKKKREVTASQYLAEGLIDYMTAPYNSSILKNRIYGLFRNEWRLKEAFQSNYDIFDAMSHLIEKRDEYTFGHVSRTRDYMNLLLGNLPESISKKYPLFLSESTKKAIQLSAQIHDIGKVAVPDSILKKKGLLDENEYEEIKKHVKEGSQALEKIQLHNVETKAIFEIALRIIRYHHCYWKVNEENKNKSYGYPEVLSGDAIPLEAQLMAIIDTYDAIRSKRSYKNEIDHATACDIIIKEKGLQFNPEIVEIFEKIEDEFNRINEMSNEQIKPA